jgi:hypothetical protein
MDGPDEYGKAARTHIVAVINISASFIILTIT